METLNPVDDISQKSKGRTGKHELVPLDTGPSLKKSPTTFKKAPARRGQYTTNHPIPAFLSRVKEKTLTVETNVSKKERARLRGTREQRAANKAIKTHNLTPPSIWREKKLKEKKQEFVRDLQTWYPELKPKDALGIIEDDSTFQELIGLEDKHIRMMMLKDLIPIVYAATRTKAQEKYTDTALKGMTALGIAIDKALEKDKRRSGSGLNIGGQNVQINVGWKPKWVKKS